MCTSIISNRKRTIVGWNLDLLDMKYRISPSVYGVYIEILDKTEGWMPLFGANRRGDFIAMPTCWPHDARSNPNGQEKNIINLNIDLLTMKKSFDEIRSIAKLEPICSIPGVTFMSSLSDKSGNVLQIIPGQGFKYFKKPVYKVLTNFSPFKGESEKHPWMGLDRYNKAEEMLRAADDDFDVKDCFEILKAVSQTVCPTVVSMVFDVTGKTVYWCENRNFEKINKKVLV